MQYFGLNFSFQFRSQKKRKTDRSKNSPFDENCENRNPLRAAEYLEEMGLGVLDTDELSSPISNSSRNTIASSQPSSVPPASALSLAISDNFGLLDDSESNENDHNHTMVPRTIDEENEDENTIGHFDLGHGSQSAILSDFLLSDSNDSSDLSLMKMASGEQLQDNTPANLVPLSRATLGTLAEHSSTLTNYHPMSGSNSKTYGMGGMVGQSSIPSEGRAIRNTSLVKFSTTNSMQKHKGRSPLAAVTCNNIHSNSSKTCPIDAKKQAEDIGFFMYQKEDPRIYKGEG